MYRFAVIFLFIVCFAGCGAMENARNAARNAESINNMKKIRFSLLQLNDENHNWPTEISEIKSVFENDSEYNEVMTNPITGDNPGYEYVQPQEGFDPSTTIVLYQLRGGTRDKSLSVTYADGSIRQP